MDDYLIRGTAYEGRVRVLAATTTGIVDEIRRRHDSWPTASAAIGRAVTAGAMMGSLLKNDRDRLTIQIRGDGPIGQIVVDANAKGEVRGYADNPHVHFPLNEKGKLAVAQAVGTTGHLHVIKDLGLREPYQGSVPLVSGELGDDFTYYFARSEQTPSAVGLGVIVNPDHSIKAAGGFIIQLFPDTDEEIIESIERHLSEISSISQMVDQGFTPEDIAREIVSDTPRIHQRQPLQFRCKCSRERVKSMLLSLGKQEIKALLDRPEGAEVECHFCNEKYLIDHLELKKMLQKLEK